VIVGLVSESDGAQALRLGPYPETSGSPSALAAVIEEESVELAAIAELAHWSPTLT
jgi:hypothetical protein